MINISIKENDISYRGKSTQEFEKKLSDYIGSYVVCTNTGTSALHLALLLSGVKQYDYILCPTITYVATANAISYCNARPYFIDAGSEEFLLNIDCKRLERYFKTISEFKIKAIMPVHVLGYPCNMEKIKEIAKEYKLVIIEDSCQALGSWYDGQHCGTIGDFGALSFNGNKILTTGGGGAFLTKDKKMQDKALHLSTQAKVIDRKSSFHNKVGYNYRMPALNARLGLIQLENNVRLKELKDQSKEKKIVHNKWRVIDHEGKKIWTPLHQLPMYKDNPRMDCSIAETISETVRIK